MFKMGMFIGWWLRVKNKHGDPGGSIQNITASRSEQLRGSSSALLLVIVPAARVRFSSRTIQEKHPSTRLRYFSW